MKCRLIREMEGVTRPDPHGPIVLVPLPVGHLIDDPDCFFLVQQSVAEPADDQCRIRAGMTPEATAAAKRAYELTFDKGIDRADWDAFEAGLMTGYDDDGNWIPGPNYVEPEIDPVTQAKWELLDELLGGMNE